VTKRDIALPQKSAKRSGKLTLKKAWKKFFRDPPKNKVLRILTYVSMGLAVVALVLACIPTMNIFGLWLAVLVVAVGLFGFFKKDGKLSNKLLIVSSAILVLAIASVTVQNLYEQSLIDRQLYLQSGDATEEILRGDLVVKFGEWSDEGLKITLRNNHAETKGYNVLVEATDKSDAVITNEMVSVGGIVSGREITLTIFRRLTEAQKVAMAEAKFEVKSVSQY